MNDRRDCGNADVLMSYLYDEGDAAERQRFEAHLAACPACVAEMAQLRGARDGLRAWTPTETVLDFRIVRDTPPVGGRFAWLAVPQLPAWAQLAAAALVVGVSVGISGLEVQYGPQGLHVRTGWQQAAAPGALQPRVALTAAQPSASGSDAPWRAELTALEERLRGELGPQAVAASPAQPGRVVAARGGRAMSDDEFLGRVRQLIEASESRQQRELALRITQAVRDFDTKRRTDLARMADGLGALEGRTGAVVAQQRDMLNYLVRVSQRQQ